MSSNEHPDMSGNPCNAPFLCDYCDCVFDEQDGWESPEFPGKLFCCSECLEDYQEEIAEGEK